MDSTEINGKTTAVVERPDLEILQDRLRSEHDLYLRALADFDNFRRRSEREVSNAVHRGKRDLILAFLEIVDSFERALQQVGNAPAPLVEGLEAIHRKTLALLETQGVTPYKNNSVGETFDPALHEAVASVISAQHAAGVVVDELQRGYLTGDTVLRPARVRVSQQP
jgi:molecular chaperone GrpE